MRMPWSKRAEPCGCPRCQCMEAERLSSAVEPGSNRTIGDVYGCLRCRTKFSVIRDEIRAFGDVALELVSHHSTEPPAPLKREDVTLVQRDPDMRWDRTR